MKTIAKKKTIPSKSLYNIKSRRKSEVIMIAMHKSQPPLHIKNPKKNLQHQKRSKKRSARELTLCASSRWNPRQTPINGSEAKNEVCGPRCVRKAISKPTFIDTSQKLNRNKELHIRTLQWASPCSSYASVSLEQSINTSLFQKEK